MLGGAGAPALLVHGLYGTATEWRSTADWLCESHETFALDQRGNGKSEKGLSDLSRDAQVKDVIATIEALDRGPVLLAGQSMGGITAFLVAARRPDLVDRLIVIEATSHNHGGDEPWLSHWPLPFQDLDAARAFFESQRVNADVWIDVLEKCGDG
ncbi:MAG TPA: alpha/beta fold hydrolase, partial [Candidatus Baltobacteraceae bacterium]|nr:alpha/beta fold hydrolase [Candidatus Baltobacteraceae bacterium]